MFCSTREVHQISALRHGAMSCKKIRRLGGAHPERVQHHWVGAREVEVGPKFRVFPPLPQQISFTGLRSTTTSSSTAACRSSARWTCPKIGHTDPFFLRPRAPPNHEVSKYAPKLQNHGPIPHPILIICTSTLVVFKLPQEEL